MVAEIKDGICILGRRFHLIGTWELKGRHFFRFRGRLVVAELKSGTCLLGHHFRVVRSSEGGGF